MPRTSIVEYSATVASGSASAVSLHAHTSCSREWLAFLPRMAAKTPLLRRLLEHQAVRYRHYHGRDLDFSRAYWRPPLEAREVLDSEMRHIVSQLGLRPIVSVTDHDTIDAHGGLAGSPVPCESPVSLEWTVYSGPACFHIGLHNLPPESAPAIAAECAAVTATCDAVRMAAVLEWVQESPGTLTVLNHPLWDGRGAGGQLIEILQDWLERHIHLLDAIEVNGYRSWEENLAVVALADRWRVPLVSGGDRHARAPNAVLNLTAAQRFADFATEVRRDRRSTILVMPDYREHRVSRTLEAVAEVLGADPGAAHGRRWIHRVFHVTDDHGDRPVAHYWNGAEPLWLRCLVGALCVLGARQARPARRIALAPEHGGGL
jgi:hypothetical protein